MSELEKLNGPAETPLVTALDVAQAKTQFDPCPQTAAFYNALRGTPAQRRNLPIDGKAVPITPQTIEAIVWNSAEVLAAPEVLDQLRAIEAKMVAVTKTCERYGVTKVSDYINQQRDELHAKMQAGEDVSSVVLESREAVVHSFAMKRHGLIAMLVKTTHEEVIPLVKPILERFERVVEQFMREQEEHDQTMCDGFGLAYRPGLLWRAAATVASLNTIERRLPAVGNWGKPSQILEGIVQL
ncbi:MAG TPA: hypothetical protein VN578_06340 [Candidatus Binatia bacterium]|jgi:hypothetical protein|nr:hypothetical protein [Candidatus Binatia bacterium]